MLPLRKKVSKHLANDEGINQETAHLQVSGEKRKPVNWCRATPKKEMCAMQAGKSRRFTIMGVRRAAPSLFCSSASRQRVSRWTALAGEFTCQTNKGVKSLSIAPRGPYCIRSK